MKSFPYSRQWITKKDIKAVTKSLTSKLITQGQLVKQFEAEICQLTGAAYAVAVSSGTAALHLAVLALELDSFTGITSPLSFVASANCILYSGGKVKFSDVDPVYHNIDPLGFGKTLTSDTRLLIPVDYAGHPCDWDKIRTIAKRQNLFIIRDACHSLGSLYQGKQAGSGDWADMTVFSFHPLKAITTGEGGMIVTNHAQLAEKCQILRAHGIIKDPDRLSHQPDPWYYEMQSLGYNYRITEFQSALGISQIKKLPMFIQQRRKIAEVYHQELGGIKWIDLPREAVHCRSAYHLYPVEINYKQFGLTRKDLMLALRKNNIFTQVHYIPIHYQPYYRNRFGFNLGDFPNAETFYQRTLSLPIYPKMKKKDAKFVSQCIKKILQIK